MILLTLPYPISANVYWRSFVPPGGKRAITHVSNEAKAYRRQVEQICAAAGIREPLMGRVAVAIRLFPQRPQDWARRARKLGACWDDDVRCIDLDNANKVLLDALKGTAIEDDKWVRRLQAERMEPDEHGPRVIVAITPLVVPAVQGDLLAAAPPDLSLPARTASAAPAHDMVLAGAERAPAAA